MPLPGSKVITDRMLAAVADTEAAARPAKVDINRPAASPRIKDPVTGQYHDATPTSVAVGVTARITPEKPRGSGEVFGERRITPAKYLVSIDRLEPLVRLNDELVITGTGDPALTGQTLGVEEIVGSTTGTAQRFVCTILES